MNFLESEFLRQLNFRSNQPVLIDVGAHHGHFSRPFAKKGWKVIAFEPEVRNYRAYIHNLSGYKKVICIPKAVSDISGNCVPFYVSEEHYGIHSLKPFHETHKFAYEVETISLDDAMVQQEIRTVTLLKIDIEGADFIALQGFDVEKYRPEIIMIEFMDKRSEQFFGYTHHDVANYMQERGYITYVSEWKSFKEYARKGEKADPHVWVQCRRYPLQHDPFWGNLLFVPKKAAAKFDDLLQNYLLSLKNNNSVQRGVAMRRLLTRVPGTQFIHNKIFDLRNRYFFQKKSQQHGA